MLNLVVKQDVSLSPIRGKKAKGAIIIDKAIENKQTKKDARKIREISLKGAIEKHPIIEKIG